MSSLVIHTVFNNIIKKIIESDIKNIRLLSDINVIKWLFGNTSFLPKTNCKTKRETFTINKQNEDIWGRQQVKKLRPHWDKNQWTTLFGEYIVEELFIIKGNTVSTPIKKENFRPDRETEYSILEVKTQTYFTTGTAGEKILGTGFKYSSIPKLYGKPLDIICLGGAEKEGRYKYGILEGTKMTQEKSAILDLLKTFDINYIGITDILKKL
jgi:hypothetical protein